MSSLFGRIWNASHDPRELITARRARSITVGCLNDKYGQKLWLTPEERATHMHVMGPTGQGKSKFLEWLIRQDISVGNGLLLIDPTGDLYDDIIAWINEKKLWKQREIILFDPSADGFSFGFNPIHFQVVPGEDTAFCAEKFADACAQVFGGEEMQTIPQLTRILTDMARTLEDNHLTLLENKLLLRSKSDTVRDYLLSKVSSQDVRGEWEQDFALQKREFEAIIGSTRNRLSPFVKAQRLRRIFGQQEKTIDFKGLMDRQAVVLVDLSQRDGRFHPRHGKLLGTLLINELVLQAQQRKRENRVPFYLYVDECQRYLTNDTEEILVGTRKYGLHCCLAHQHIGQLKEAGEAIYGAVMNCAKTKVIFGGLEFEYADQMVRNLFLPEIDYEEPIKALIKPTAVGQEKVILRTGTKTVTEGDTEQWSDTTTSGKSAFESLTGETGFFSNLDAVPTAGKGTNEANANSRGGAKQTAIAQGDGWSEAYKTVYKDMPGAVYSSSDQILKMTTKLMTVPAQHAVIKPPQNNARAQFLHVPTVEPVLTTPERIAEVKQEQIEQLRTFYTPVDEVDRLILERRARIARECAVPLSVVGMRIEKDSVEEDGDFEGYGKWEKG